MLSLFKKINANKNELEVLSIVTDLVFILMSHVPQKVLSFFFIAQSETTHLSLLFLKFQTEPLQQLLLVRTKLITLNEFKSP